MGDDGGAYKTMENLATKELVLDDMKLHMSVHQALSDDMTIRKATKMERPTSKDQHSDAGWELSTNNNWSTMQQDQSICDKRRD